MMRKHPYEILLDRKRKWSPVKPTVGELKYGSEDTIRRALAARHLELPVGSFIKEGLEKDVPANARKLLEDNVKDEERHDLALGYYADALGVDETTEKEGKLLRDAWIEHPDHTITKALVAERAIFFVLLPFFGLLVTRLSERYQLTFPEMNKSTLLLILLFVGSWGYMLVFLWINLGKPPLIGFFNH